MEISQLFCKLAVVGINVDIMISENPNFLINHFRSSVTYSSAFESEYFGSMSDCDDNIFKKYTNKANKLDLVL